MENYLHPDAINEAYKRVCNITLGLAVPFSEFEDVPVKVAELVHTISGSPTAWVALDDETRGKKVSKVKRMLNEQAASSMTKERLDHVDPDGHVVSWFNEMKVLANV